VSDLKHEERLEAVVAALRETGATTVLDLGCGDGVLAVRLAHEPQIRRVVGIDLSEAAVATARRRVRDLPADIAAKVTLVQGCMMEPRLAFAGFDAAVLVETIEHLPPGRLSALERAVFLHARPVTVIVTTPNAEFNVLLGVPSHRMRHPDHRFEWDRAKFRAWCGGIAGRHGYGVLFNDIAGRHPTLGGPTQMAVFRCLVSVREEGRELRHDRVEILGQIGAGGSRDIGRQPVHGFGDRTGNAAERVGIAAECHGRAHCILPVSRLEHGGQGRRDGARGGDIEDAGLQGDLGREVVAELGENALAQRLHRFSITG
jgi:SAM-dependent methyltransferase